MGSKILIIEDDAVTLRTLEAQLKAGGFQTHLAYDGVTALQAAQKDKPDLILLDLGLPGGDGFNVMQRFKQLPRLAAIPIIVFSARDPDPWKERTLQAGAVAYLPKPLSNETLMASVRSQLPGEEPGAQEQKAKKKILIIEDDADTRLGLSVRLRANAYEVALAADSASAMTVGLREKPDLIILDLGLPAGDGYLLLERLRRHPILERAPIIVLTARDPRTNEERALKAGAVAFFQKPADNDKFLAAIREALK